MHTTDELNPYKALHYMLIVIPLEVVSHCRDIHLQVGENYSHMYNINQNIRQSRYLFLFFEESKTRFNGNRHG